MINFCLMMMKLLVWGKRIKKRNNQRVKKEPMMMTLKFQQGAKKLSINTIMTMILIIKRKVINSRRKETKDRKRSKRNK